MEDADLDDADLDAEAEERACFGVYSTFFPLPYARASLFPRVELRTVNKHVAPVAKAERKVLMSWDTFLEAEGEIAIGVGLLKSSSLALVWNTR